MGSFFIPKILVNLFFRVTRMTDEDGRIERVRDVENIVKIHRLKRGEIRKQAKSLKSSRLWTAGKQVTTE